MRGCSHRAWASPPLGDARPGGSLSPLRRVWLCGRWRGLSLRRLLQALSLCWLTFEGQHEAPLEQRETGAPKHLALKQFQARDLPLHRPTTPGQSDPGFDRVVIIAESFGKPPPGSHGTLGGTREPGRQLLGLPLAHEVSQVLGEGDRLGHVRMLRAQLGERLGVVLGALFCMPHNQPGRLTSGEEPWVGLGHDRKGLPRQSLSRRLAQRLAQALGIAGDRRLAPRIAPLLDLVIQARRIAAASVPPFQEIGFVGIEDTVATVAGPSSPVRLAAGVGRRRPWCRQPGAPPDDVWRD